MKLATWNIELPKSAKRRKALLLYTDRQHADVWVLTESHDSFRPGLAFSYSSAARCDGHRGNEHHWVTIWSRYPLERLPTSDDKRTAAARIMPESGDPFVVYGSVLPWIGSSWREHPSAGGAAFREALAAQTADWMRIRQDYPTDEFFVLGDLNQDLVSPRYYGSRANRALLEKALGDSGLVSLTAGDRDPIRRDSAPYACIDHICARRDSSWHPEPAVRWPDAAMPEKSLSDHFGLSISFVRR